MICLHTSLGLLASKSNLLSLYLSASPIVPNHSPPSDYSHYNYHRHSGSITCSGHRECCNGVCQYPHKYQYTVRHGYITKCTTVLELDGQDRGYYEDQAYKIVKDYKDEECHIEVYDQECESCTMTYNDAIHEWCLEFSCLNTNATTSGNTCDQDYASPLKGIFEKAPQYSEF